MAQNIYDQPDFEGYSQFGRLVEGLAGTAEWPALCSMLPDLTGAVLLGKQVMDPRASLA
jgi:hypothetical protein